MEKKGNLKGSIFDRSREQLGSVSFTRNEFMKDGKPEISKEQERRQRQEEEYRRSSELEWKKNHFGR